MAIARKARRLILLGTTARKIEEAVRRAGDEIDRMPEITHATRSGTCIGTRRE